MPNWTWNEIKFGFDPKEIFAVSNTQEDKFSFNNITPMPEEILNTTAGGYVSEIMAAYILRSFNEPKRSEALKNVGVTLNFDLSDKASVDEFIAKYGTEMDEVHRDNPETGQYEAIKLVSGEQYYNMHMKYGFHDWYEWSYANWGVKWDASNVTVNRGEKHTLICFETPWGYPDEIFEKICRMYPDKEIKFFCEFECGVVTYAENRDGIFTIINNFERCDDSSDDPSEWVYEDTVTGEKVVQDDLYDHLNF